MSGRCPSPWHWAFVEWWHSQVSEWHNTFLYKQNCRHLPVNQLTVCQPQPLKRKAGTTCYDFKPGYDEWGLKMGGKKVGVDIWMERKCQGMLNPLLWCFPLSSKGLWIARCWLEHLKKQTHFWKAKHRFWNTNPFFIMRDSQSQWQAYDSLHLSL